MWDEDIAKDVTALERLGVLQIYLLKTKFEKKYDWKYAPIHMIFDVKYQYLQHKARLVVGVHVVYYTEHTRYSSTIKYVSVRLIILIAVKNGLGLVAGDIGNSFFMAPCAENIWPCCGA